MQSNEKMMPKCPESSVRKTQENPKNPVGLKKTYNDSDNENNNKNNNENDSVIYSDNECAFSRTLGRKSSVKKGSKSVEPTAVKMHNSGGAF